MLPLPATRARPLPSRLIAAALLAATACARPPPRNDRGSTSSENASATAAARAEPAPGPIRIDVLDTGGSPPTFVMRGEPRGPGRLVFLHGMCGHGLGYAQSFQFSAAQYGTLISPQGDRACGAGPWAKWSSDLDALDARISAAFAALGHPEPLTDVLVIGYSQGATRAEALARRWPERYSRLILIGAPDAPSPRGLGALRGAIMMAGERDRQDLMKKGLRAFTRSGIPATFIEIPGARHGEMGPTPELTMGRALDWLHAHQR